MDERELDGSSRRRFLQSVGWVGAAGLLPLSGQARKATIFLVDGASDVVLASRPVQWAAGELRQALAEKGLPATVQSNLEGLETAGEKIVVSPAGSEMARKAAGAAGLTLPARAESFAFLPARILTQPALLIAGSDTRGVVYGVLELADRVRYGDDPAAVLRTTGSALEQPANEIRSVARLFVSELEDKGWFYDRSFWTPYLSMLASQRFNRFSLTLGLGYDLPRQVLDAYFIFAYPFLLRVPGYNVRVPGLPAEEPERNLEMLQWISRETAARGLHFQLGLWSHTYQWIDSPKANYVIEGLDDRNHARYCRDALRLLLESCPAISGITFRAHSESGIGDGSYDFWKEVFAGVKDCGRRVEMDLHSKGIEDRHIQMALETGQPVRVSTKHSAEHMGLPAHQIAIREMERTQPSSTPQERAFTRYGYADYLAADRPYGVYFRLWPGKDRVLLWGDPAIVAGYGRYASFCGAQGLEMCEPLSFKGRQGSGLSTDRRIYADSSLAPRGGDWQKYLYTYRLWGRHLYDPDTNPESYRRWLRAEFGEGASPVETSLANASRVIPLVTSSHLPSASAMTFWPEVYSNMPVADEKQPHIYGDTPSPKIFGRVSPLDPGLFMNAYEYAEELSGAAKSGRYSPSDVALWLDGFARTAEEQLEQARLKVKNANDPAFRRLAVDVRVQLGLGRFFAAKMRSAVAWALYQKDGQLENLRAALHFGRAARNAWAGIVEDTRGVYLEDLTFGYPRHRRGHWTDRLPSIEKDVQFLERVLAEKTGGSVAQAKTTEYSWLKPKPNPPTCAHTPPPNFRPGEPLELSVTSPAGSLSGIKVHFRPVNQAETYRVEPMASRSNRWRITIAGEQTQSRFAFQYQFQLQGRDGTNWLYPGLSADLANQPYFVLLRG